MRAMGAAAPCSHPVVEEVGDALFAGRAVFLWSNGEDVVAFLGDEGEAAEAVLKMAQRTLVEFA
jgi:hypothetical protein